MAIDMIPVLVNSEKEDTIVFGTILGSQLVQKYPLENTERITVHVLQEIKKYWNKPISNDYSEKKLEHTLGQITILISTIPIYLKVFPKLSEITLSNLGGIICLSLEMCQEYSRKPSGFEKCYHAGTNAMVQLYLNQTET